MILFVAMLFLQCSFAQFGFVSHAVSSVANDVRHGVDDVNRDVLKPIARSVKNGVRQDLIDSDEVLGGFAKVYSAGMKDVGSGINDAFKGAKWLGKEAVKYTPGGKTTWKVMAALNPEISIPAYLGYEAGKHVLKPVMKVMSESGHIINNAFDDASVWTQGLVGVKKKYAVEGADGVVSGIAAAGDVAALATGGGEVLDALQALRAGGEAADVADAGGIAGASAAEGAGESSGLIARSKAFWNDDKYMNKFDNKDFLKELKEDPRQAVKDYLKDLKEDHVNGWKKIAKLGKDGRSMEIQKLIDHPGLYNSAKNLLWAPWEMSSFGKRKIGVFGQVGNHCYGFMCKKRKPKSRISHRSLLRTQYHRRNKRNHRNSASHRNIGSDRNSGYHSHHTQQAFRSAAVPARPVYRGLRRD